MVRLPVIVGFGGFSAAGRSSSHHAYRRTVIDSIDETLRNQTLLGLAAMMKLVRFDQESGLWVDLAAEQDVLLTDQAVIDKYAQAALDGSLIRKIEPQYFNVDAVEWHKSVALAPEGNAAYFMSRERDLPEPLPSCWQVSPIEGEPGRVKVTITDTL